MKKVKKIDKSVDEMKNKLVRALADYDNLQKRVEREQGQRMRMANLMLILKLFPVVDMLGDVQRDVENAGLEIAIKEFKEVFGEHGYEEVRPEVGVKFDEKYMEVIEIVDGGKKGMVAGIVLPGWKLDDKVVRPAKVEVYK